MARRYLVFYSGLAIAALIIRATWTSTVGDWDTSPLKSWLVPLATLFLDTFNNPATGLLLSALLILLAAGLAVRFWFFRVAPASQSMRRAAAAMAALPPAADPAARVRIVESALGRYSALNRELHVYFRHRSELAKHSVEAITLRPESYLTMRALDRSGIGLSSFGQLPGYMVGVGLSLTFCGLVAGLYFASKGLLAADLDSARKSLVQLLNAATFKFLTSITGVGLSIVLSIVHQAALDRLGRDLAEVCFNLEERQAVTLHQVKAA